MAVPLYDYQSEAVRNLKNGSILCSVVGSGKSRTALAYYYCQNGGHLNRDGNVEITRVLQRDLYIITTAKKRDSKEWDIDMSPFLMGTDPKYHIYKTHVVVDSWNNIKKYRKIYGAFFIFDEQRVTGSGPWTRAFLDIARKNQWILLSATPGDKWEDYIPVFVANGFYRNKTQFEARHIVYNPYCNFKKVDKYLEEDVLEKLRSNILVDMDYQLVAEEHHQTIECEYDIQKYRKIMLDRWNVFTNEPIQNVSEFCACLRRVVNSDNTRAMALSKIVDSFDRVIVFYNYDFELDIIKSIQFKPDVVVAEWNGHKHEPIPDSNRWIYLVNYNAGAEGWNCIKTNCMLFYSENYSYRTMTQAAGRINRNNTPYKNLFYFHLKSNAPIDKAIDRALKNKKKFNEISFIGKE